MTDSTITDFTKMKVVDLRKELKARGLPSSGDKATLISRIQSSQDTMADTEEVNLDSDEFDSDGVLNEEDSALNKELILAEVENPPPPPPDVESELLDPTEVTEPPQPSLKRKIDDKETDKESDHVAGNMDTQDKEGRGNQKTIDQEPITEKDDIMENAAKVNKTAIEYLDAFENQKEISSISSSPEKSEEMALPAPTPDGDTETPSESKRVKISAPSSVDTEEMALPAPTPDGDTETPSESKRVKISAPSSVDNKTRLELRAQRFGLPAKASEADQKDARQQRFGQFSNTSSYSIISNAPAHDLEKLKKRGERFGQSVSKFITDIEQNEKLEKRRAKFETN